MHKYNDRALLKAVIGLMIVFAVSLSRAQDRPVLAAAANFPAAAPEVNSGNSSSRLPDDAIIALPVEAAQPSPFVAVQPGANVELPREMVHHFWDRENAILFGAVAATATADFFTTHANLASGGRELNPITRVFAGSTPTLAANFGLETAGVIGLSYMFHKTGHHRLERLTSFVDIGSSAGAVSYGLTHR
jgi:hypothetical protein